MRKLILAAFMCSASVCWADERADTVVFKDPVHRDISCAMLLLTSNPPKRALSFTLDNTPYVAIVTVTADRPQLTHAAQR